MVSRIPSDALATTPLAVGYAATGDIPSSYSLLEGDHEALPVLLMLLQSKSVKVRRVAISGLCLLGKGIPEAIPALVVAAEDPDEQVRQEAHQALVLLDPKGGK